MGDRKFFLTEQGNARNNKANAAILGRLPTVQKKTRRVPPVSGAQIIFGRATSAISAATSPLAPTAFTFVEFLTDDATVTPHTQKEDTEEKDGVNEWPIGGGVDSIVCMSFTKGEWHLVNFIERCQT